MAGIEGKVVAVTGASSGIGAATARRLAGLGARVVLGARGTERLEALAGEISAAGGEVASVVTDVRRRQDLERLVRASCEAYGRLDVLVSNAGVMPVSPLDDLRVADWEEMIDVNLKGVLYGIAAALPVFRAQGSGHFVNVGSTATLRTVPNQSVYSGTKLAVRAISEGLRQESSGGFRVTVITPGFTNTSFTDAVTDPRMRAELGAARDRMAQPPDAVARAIAFAIEQPDDIDVNEVVVRPAAQA